MEEGQSEVFSAETKCGMSMMMLKTALELRKRGVQVFWIDLEASPDIDLMKSLGIEPKEPEDE